MGMFDGLKKKLKEFTGKVSEEAEVAPPAPASRVQAPSALPKKPNVDEKKASATFEVIKREGPSPAAPHAPKPAPSRAPAPPQMPLDEPAPLAATPRPAPVVQAPKAPPTSVADGDGRAINVEKIDDLLWDLELSLLESDVALPVVEEIKETLKTNLKKVRVKSATDVPKAVEDALRAAILEALTLERIDFDLWLLEHLEKKRPLVLMFVGVNGTGKTTAIGRIAHRLKENGFTSVMAAGDTFRAGAIEQLSKHGEKLGITVIKHNAGGDPAAVAYDAIEHAKSRMKDVVLLDTAGRMQTNTNLMDEMKKIKRVAQPDMIIFVGDSLAGNDAVEQAIQFDKAVGIDASILTKVDTDAKGGAALSIAHAVGKPILFVGVGQEYGDLVPYDPEWMVARIFD